MPEKRVKRKPVAILAANLVGDSQLIRSADTKIRARVNVYLNEQILALVGKLHGRIYITGGGNLLAEPGSACNEAQW